MLAQGSTGTRHYGEHGERRGDALSVFVNSFAPPPRMLVFGAIDFAAAVADPSDPARLNPAYASGDHLHLNDAGYHAMADAVDLTELLGEDETG